MRLSTYRRAMRGAARGLHGPKQRRAMRIRAALVNRRPTTKRAYRRAARLGSMAVAGIGVLAAVFLLGGRARRTAP